MTYVGKLRRAEEAADERIALAIANVKAALQQIRRTPDDPTAQAWVESARREAEDAKAVGQELGL